MSYVLAQIQLSYGRRNLQRFNDAIPTLVELLGQRGIQLRDALISEYGGQLYEVFNLWQVDDASHMARARASLVDCEDYQQMHAQLSDVIESESVRYLERLPYGPRVSV